MCLTENSKDPKNPYTIYKKLKNLTCTDVPSDVLPNKEWNGKRITIDPKAFRSLAENKKIVFERCVI